jgi:hypothetical protein
MNRLCERPGCSAPAEVAYGFDADRQSVWLDALVAVQGMRHGVLCRRHADAMVVPLGWMLDDRREPTLRLFKAPAVDTPPPNPRRERRIRDATGEQLRLDPHVIAATSAVAVADDGEPTSLAAPATRPEPPATDATETAAPGGNGRSDAAWLPVFDPADDLHGLLNARGRLLSRAFNGAPSDHHH